MLPALAHVDCWIFDLDNSLYPASADLLGQMEVRMADYVCRLHGCSPEDGRRIQKAHFHEHGTTLAGLMASHDIDPRDFLTHAHDIDLDGLASDPRLGAAIERLPGRKYVFTNGDADYAGRVLGRIGLGNAFDGMHDITAMGYVPKPDPRCYAQLCARFDIDARKALFVDDMARNLKPAKAIGMTTAWINNGSDQGGHGDDHGFIDYHIGSLTDWLTGILEEEHA
jgi:putative hydrolase of the HAD superfamily